MKKMKKVLSLILTVVMVLAMAAPAMAATVTVTNNVEGHTFKAYQIFSGTQAEDGKLGDVIWGSGIEWEAENNNFLTALKALAVDTEQPFADCVTALDVANVLGGLQNNSETAREVAELAYEYKKSEGTEISQNTTQLDPGYYLIVDVTEFEKGSTNTVYNAALLEVTNNIIIGDKKDVPTVEKKVEENSSDNSNWVDIYNDVADYNIGDIVPFKLTSKIPDMTYYDSYTFTYHDTMDTGLSLINEEESGNNPRAYIVNADGTEKEGVNVEITVKTGEEVTCETEKCTFEIEVTLKNTNIDYTNTANEKLVVEYNAKLNENAIIGSAGNKNTVYLEYSNNPNDADSTGETPKDEVIVFTYELDVTKIKADEENIKLQGAEFKLHRGTEENKEWAVVDAQNSKITNWVTDKAEASTLTSDVNGEFKVIGLDEGTYYLEETNAPAGYNKLTEEIQVKIEATTNNGNNGILNALTALKVYVGTTDATGTAGNIETGVVSVTVENNIGATLPSTGGIGTTIFYLVGILVMAGAVFFAIRSRKNEN